MSGGGNSTTTKTEPNSGSKELYDTASSDALTAYKNGTLTGSSDVSTAVPMSSSSYYGLLGQENMANAYASNDPFGSMFDDFKSTYGNGGYNDEQRTAIKNITGTANGQYLDESDPYFEKVLSTTKENTGNEVNSMMSGMGRFAGGAHQGILTDKLANVENQARSDQYNKERDRQTDAIKTLFGMGQTGMDNTAKAGDVWQSYYDASSAPYKTLQETGAARESYTAQEKNDEARKADSTYNDLLALLGIAQGTGGGYSTSTSEGANSTASNVGGGLYALLSLLS